MSKPFSISVTWHIEDCLELDPELTQAQCIKVLTMAKDNHDAEVGINWDVIQDCIDRVKGN